MLRDALEFRRLRRLMPVTPRMWVREPRRGMRPETDAEYLDRLRQLAVQRFPQGRARDLHARGPQKAARRFEKKDSETA